MEKAGLYVRLSDEDEGKVRKDDLSNSIINQKKLFEKKDSQFTKSTVMMIIQDCMMTALALKHY